MAVDRRNHGLLHGQRTYKGSLSHGAPRMLPGSQFVEVVTAGEGDIAGAGDHHDADAAVRLRGIECRQQVFRHGSAEGIADTLVAYGKHTHRAARFNSNLVHQCNPLFIEAKPVSAGSLRYLAT